MLKIAGKIENFPRGNQGGPGNNWGAVPMPFGSPVPNHQSWSNGPGRLNCAVSLHVY